MRVYKSLARCPVRKTRGAEVIVAKRDSASETFDRTLPHNLEAERAVLGAVLIYNDLYLKAARAIQSPHDFYRRAHAVIWESIVTLLERPHGKADIVTVKDHLAGRSLLDDVGGPAYIANLVDGIPRSTNISEYARLVREKSRLRATIAIGNKMLAEAFEAEDTADDILREADVKILALQQGRFEGRMQPLTKTAGNLLEVLEERYKQRGTVIGIDTGFQRVNDLTLGWQRGEMIVGAARPSVGKTALTLSLAKSAASTTRPNGDKRHVALFSLEMKRQALESRMLAMLSGVPLSAIQSGYLFEQHWGPLSHAIGELAELNIHIDDTAHRTMQDIRAECRRLRSEHGLDLVIIDYLQLVTSTLKTTNRSEQVADISRKVKILADELDVPLIALSQLSRASTQRGPDTPPQLSDLRESGALEQDGDTVWFLHRSNHRESGPTQMIFQKQRNGSTGSITLLFDRDTQRFSEAPVDAPEQVAEPRPKKTLDEWARLKAIQKARARQKSS